MKNIFLTLVVLCGIGLMAGCKTSDYDGRKVLYPTTEIVTDSFVTDSTPYVWRASVRIKGHLSDTMHLSFYEAGDNFSEDLTLIGDIDEEFSNDWYDYRLHIQYRSNAVTKGDSVIITCDFAQ
ncbi:MAG: hypothetical protein K6E93_06135 [Bacteroidales bacterium]|nr:hypothetical protein [Bacteroidales bacterium]